MDTQLQLYLFLWRRDRGAVFEFIHAVDMIVPSTALQKSTEMFSEISLKLKTKDTVAIVIRNIDFMWTWNEKVVFNQLLPLSLIFQEYQQYFFQIFLQINSFGQFLLKRTT